MIYLHALEFLVFGYRQYNSMATFVRTNTFTCNTDSYCIFLHIGRSTKVFQLNIFYNACNTFPTFSASFRSRHLLHIFLLALHTYVQSWLLPQNTDPNMFLSLSMCVFFSIPFRPLLLFVTWSGCFSFIHLSHFFVHYFVIKKTNWINN